MAAAVNPRAPDCRPRPPPPRHPEREKKGVLFPFRLLALKLARLASLWSRRGGQSRRHSAQRGGSAQAMPQSAHGEVGRQCTRCTLGRAIPRDAPIHGAT